jgi:LemA protein
MYNKGISLKNYVEEAFSTMDVYLKKRWDLIPNLVEITKGYMAHEKELFEKITSLRNQNYSSLNNEQKLDINSKLDMGISKLIATVENYPDLKANQNFLQLMNDLSEVENEIANSRKYYNGTVRELNNYTEYFPSNIVAMISGIKPQKMFQIEDSQRENIKVNF